MQERQEAWNSQSANSKKWHAQPHPGKPAEGEPEPQKASTLTVLQLDSQQPASALQEYEPELHAR